MPNNDEKINAFQIVCVIRSHSHKLNSEAFKLFMTGGSNIAVRDVKEETLMLAIENRYTDSVEHFVLIAHNIFLHFIMALNIATLGHFTWDSSSLILLFYMIENPKYPNRRTIVSMPPIGLKSDVISQITEKEIKQTALLFDAICKDAEDDIKKEYIKGILHLSFGFFELDFHKEAFANFYRVFENVATQRILKARKLSNELRELQDVIRSNGFGDDIAEEFGLLYKLRCDQVMHAQKKQSDIDIDNALKMKTILDGVLHNLYRPIWEDSMHRIRDLSVEENK